MDRDTATTVASEIYDQIGRLPGWEGEVGIAGLSVDTLVRRALTSVALLNGPDVPEYVAGNYEDGSGVVHVFGSARVVTADLTAGEDATWTVTARARSSLRHVEMQSRALIGDWPPPGGVSVVAHYEDGHTIEIPSKATRGQQRVTAFLAFLPSLLADMG